MKLKKNHFTLRVLLGNIFEHYDTALFGFLSPFIATQFFGSNDPFTAIIKAYALLPLGMISKPLGSVFFGWFGDVFSHRRALRVSLYGMALCSLLICLIPSYESVGAFSGLLLGICRLLQSFFAAGEHIGGAICLLENEERFKRSLLSTLYSSSTILGIILASAAVAAFAFIKIVHSHWRWLYLLGVMTAICAAMIPAEEVKKKRTKVCSFKDRFEQLRTHKLPFLWIFIASGFSYSCYSLAFIATHALVPFVSDLSAEACSAMNSLLLVLDFFLFPLFALAAHRISAFTLMQISAAAVVFCGFFVIAQLQGASWLEAFFLRGCIVLIGVSFSAYFHAWCVEVAPQSLRQTTISLAYSAGSQLLGAPTAFVTLFLYQNTHSLLFASLYWVALAICTTLCVQMSYKVYYYPKKVMQ